jgi:hypothetical protein
VNPDLGAPNRGLGERLNHLADYVYSVRHFVRNPYLAAETPAADAERGRALFNDPEVGCAGCHDGPSAENQLFTDKAQKNPFFDPSDPADARNNPFLRHDVGTTNKYDEVDPLLVAVTDDVFHNRPAAGDPNDMVMPGSRAALREYLTPILTDVWLTAPYLHDGSAPTLLDVVRPCNSTQEECCNPVETDCAGKNTGRNVDDRHGRTSHLDETGLQDLVAFLLAPRGAIAELPAPPPADTQPPREPPDLPPANACPEAGPEPEPVGESATLTVHALGGTPTGLTIDLPSVGFTLPVEASGLVIGMFVDEERGIIQLDGRSAPRLLFDTPAGPAVLNFDDRLFEGTIDHESGDITIEGVRLTLEFLGEQLCYVFTLKTGPSTLILDGEYTVSGQPFDEESGDVVLADVVLGPPSPLSPPLVTVLILEGTLLTDGGHDS